MKATRVLAGLMGVALMGVGGSLLMDVRDLTGVLVWLGGAVVLHDAVIAPLVLLAGLVLVRGRARGPVRGALVVAGALTVVALPVLLRPGRTANSSVLPLDYPRNWLVTVVVVASVTAVWLAVRKFRDGRRRPVA
jgi:MFS family permease